MAKASALGVGLGLRMPFLEQVAGSLPDVPFWEVAPENVIGEGGRAGELTREVLSRYPVLSHGLSLSVGGFDPWDPEYLGQLAAFLQASGCPWHSEHLCFSSVDGAATHELLPLPFTSAAVRHTAARARDLKNRLPVPLLLENITCYAELGRREMDEASFLAEVLEAADVGWLLDVNNIYVNALNFGFDPRAWLEGMPFHRVRQIHVAGFQTFGDLVLDTHGAPVAPPVIDLLRIVLARVGRPVPVLLERDHAIPPLEELLAERASLQEVVDQTLSLPEGA